MAHFIQNLNHVWVCDSGKIGSFYLRLARLLKTDAAAIHREDGEVRTISSELLVSKAIDAGEFLLRMQLTDVDDANSTASFPVRAALHESLYLPFVLQSSYKETCAPEQVDAVPGDLSGSVYSTETGNVTHPSNFAGTVCAVLLWSDLYNATGNLTWLNAAERAVAAIRAQWMQPGAYMLCGGELDDLFNPKGPCSDIGTTSVMWLLR